MNHEKIKPTRKSLAVQALLSERTRKIVATATNLGQKLRGNQSTVEFYYQVDDPCSRLLAQFVPSLIGKYSIQFKIKLVGQPADNVMPQREAAQNYAMLDAGELCSVYDLDWANDAKAPSPETILNAQRRLALCSTAEDFLETEAQLAPSIWSDNLRLNETTSASVSQTKSLIADNETRRGKLGHYYGGMLYFENEWFWGIDRIPFLEQRLHARNLQNSTSNTTLLAKRDTPSTKPLFSDGNVPEPLVLNYYYSFRSPYSYLSIQRVIDLANKFKLKLNIKPVMPMVMRGLAVPRSKALYIVRDCARLSNELNIPFGRIADPVGVGIDRVIAIYPVAAKQHKEIEYLETIGRGVWAEGLDVVEDGPLRHLVERAGLTWSDAKRAMENPDPGRNLAEQNATALRNLGLWGVPSLHIGTHAMWGQDRIDLLGEKLRLLP